MGEDEMEDDSSAPLSATTGEPQLHCISAEKAVYLRADGENAEVRTKLWPILTAIEGDEKELNGSRQEVHPHAADL